MLGAASNDTDEFDQHVVAHEFHHFLEDAVSRADSVGGTHSLDERLDPRVAFSEGFANAFSAMVLDDPVYRDSFGVAQGEDFSFNMESDASTRAGLVQRNVDPPHRLGPLRRRQRARRRRHARLRADLRRASHASCATACRW